MKYSRAIQWNLFASTIILCFYSIAQAAIVSIDTSELSVEGIKIFGKGNYASIDTLDIAPGSYFMGYVSEGPNGTGGVAGFDFSIESDGSFSYSTELDTIVSGRGSSHLVVHGVPIQIKSDLSVKDLWVNSVISWEVRENNPMTVRLLPGKHSVGYYSQISDGSVAFNGFNLVIKPQGYAEVDANLMSAVLGSGTSLIHLIGHEVSIQSALSANDTYLFAVLSWRRSEENPKIVHLLPGIYGVGYVSVTQDGNFLNGLDFTLEESGNIFYTTDLEGTLTGAGSSQLFLNGMPINLNFLDYRSSIPLFYLNAVAGYDNNMLQTAKVFPGTHEIYYWIGRQMIDVTDGGACDLDARISSSEIFYKGSNVLVCANRSPVLSLTDNAQTIELGDLLEFGGMVSDPDMNDSGIQLSVDYGDGSIQQQQILGEGFLLSHLYLTTGVYQVRLSLVDSSQGITSSAFEVTVNQPVVTSGKKSKKSKKLILAKKKNVSEKSQKKWKKFKESQEFLDKLKLKLSLDKQRIKK